MRFPKTGRRWRPETVRRWEIDRAIAKMGEPCGWCGKRDTNKQLVAGPNGLIEVCSERCSHKAAKARDRAYAGKGRKARKKGE